MKLPLYSLLLYKHTFIQKWYSQFEFAIVWPRCIPYHMPISTRYSVRMYWLSFIQIMCHNTEYWLRQGERLLTARTQTCSNCKTFWPSLWCNLNNPVWGVFLIFVCMLHYTCSVNMETWMGACVLCHHCIHCNMTCNWCTLYVVVAYIVMTWHFQIPGQGV